jgi:hypothetical protein
MPYNMKFWGVKLKKVTINQGMERFDTNTEVWSVNSLVIQSLDVGGYY